MATGNTKYGDGALENNTTNTSPAGANNNSAFGIGALQNSSNYWNTAVGAYSGNSTTTGISNSSLGVNALLKNTTGSYNTALGTASLCFNETGNNNTSVGSNALENNTANQNTAVGAGALNLNTSGSDNTAIGTDAGNTLTTGSNNICIGNNAQPSSATADNEIAIGTSAETMYIQGGFNMRVGPLITLATPAVNFLTTPLCQFYVVTTSAVIIQLPIPTSVYKGAQVNFVRHGVAAFYTFQTIDTPSANLYFWNLDAAAASNTLATGAAISSIMLWCDGTYWNSQFYGII